MIGIKMEMGIGKQTGVRTFPFAVLVFKHGRTRPDRCREILRQSFPFSSRRLPRRLEKILDRWKRAIVFDNQLSFFFLKM